jgi:hypothetical protein
MSSEIETIQSMMASLDTHSRQVPDGLYLDMSNQLAKLYNLHGGGGGGGGGGTYTPTPASDLVNFFGIVFCGLFALFFRVWNALFFTCSRVTRVVRGAPIVSKKVATLDELLGNIQAGETLS